MNNFERFIIGDCTIIRHTNFTFRAVLVVIRITPLAPRFPYMAQEAASLRIETLAISEGLTILMLCSIPSTRIRGLEEFNVPTPRML